MNIKKYNYMHDDVVLIRTVVFVDEQDFKEEFDDIDNKCTFLVMYDEDKPVAMCRYFPESLKHSEVAQNADDVYVIGRIAVMKEYRGNGLGSVMVEEAEKHVRALGVKVVVLSAQTRAREFYEKLGYVGEGDVYYEEWCEHILMRKKLNIYQDIAISEQQIMEGKTKDAKLSLEVMRKRYEI